MLSATTSWPISAKPSGQRMQRIVPSMSSRSNMTYFDGLPGCGFLVCENLIDEIMPPRIDFFALFELRNVGCRVRAVCGERRLVLGERMAGEIEAEHLFSF